jgi:hypothetical protein
MRALEVLQNKVIALTSNANLIHPVEFMSVEEAIEPALCSPLTSGGAKCGFRVIVFEFLAMAVTTRRRR